MEAYDFNVGVYCWDCSIEIGQNHRNEDERVLQMLEHISESKFDIITGLPGENLEFLHNEESFGIAEETDTFWKVWKHKEENKSTEHCHTAINDQELQPVFEGRVRVLDLKTIDNQVVKDDQEDIERVKERNASLGLRTFIVMREDIEDCAVNSRFKESMKSLDRNKLRIVLDESFGNDKTSVYQNGYTEPEVRSDGFENQVQERLKDHIRNVEGGDRSVVLKLCDVQ